MRTLYFLFFCILTGAGKAQTFTHFEPDMKTVWSTVSKVNFQQFSLNNFNRLLFLKDDSYKTPFNFKWDYTVVFKDSSTITGRSKMYIDQSKGSLFLEFKNKNLSKKDTDYIQRIYPSETLTIGRFDKEWNMQVNAVPADSCWFFPILTGRINAYSIFSEDASVEYGGFSAIQFDNGKVEAFDPVKLKEIIKNNSKAMKAFNKKDYYNAIKKFNEKEIRG